MSDSIECQIMADLDDKVLSSPRKWGRGQMYNPETGRCCLLGGLQIALRDLEPSTRQGRAYVNQDRAYVNLKRALADEIRKGHSASRSGIDAVGIITRFNDNPDTKFRDVKAVVKAVRAKVCDG